MRKQARPYSAQKRKTTAFPGGSVGDGGAGENIFRLRTKSNAGPMPKIPNQARRRRAGPQRDGEQRPMVRIAPNGCGSGVVQMGLHSGKVLLQRGNPRTFLKKLQTSLPRM